MPWWPIMMPSDAVGAPKICGTPPAARMPSIAFRASRSRWALHGVISLKSDATPIIGRLKSSSRKPTPRSIARLGARPMPSVVSRLRRLRSGMTRSKNKPKREEGSFPCLRFGLANILLKIFNDWLAVGHEHAVFNVGDAGRAPQALGDFEHFLNGLGDHLDLLFSGRVVLGLLAATGRGATRGDGEIHAKVQPRR